MTGRKNAWRKRFNELLAKGDRKSAEAAALFYYLNRTGYNGLCRFFNRFVPTDGRPERTDIVPSGRPALIQARGIQSVE